MQYFHNPNIDFMGKRMIFIFVSVAIMIFGLISVTVLGVQYGIDFKGGTEIAVKFYKPVSTEQIRFAINKVGLYGNEIKSFGKGNQFLIRTKESQNAPTIVDNALKKSFPDARFETLKVDKIGPKIGSELRTEALIAVILSVIAILIYIAFRFEFVFGLGAIVALVHDVLITFSFIVIFQHTGLFNLELNQSILAAILTVIGYSINDTVIIFDRIRENREKYKGKSFITMVNMSINETLSRTVNTVATTLLVLLTLVFFGGPVLEGFAFTMTIGIITGTYSSIYVASSFVIWYLHKVKKVDTEKGFEKKELAAAVK